MNGSGKQEGSTAARLPALRDQRLFRQSCFIDGAWRDAGSGGTIAVDDPATGTLVGTVPKFGAAETREAIEAAQRALAGWRARTAKERAFVLRRWYELMLEHQDDLARLMTIEQGKPLLESRGEVAYAAAFLEWFGEEAKRVYGDIIPGHQADKRILVVKQPIGVVGCITPWNFPLAMITRKAGPAIASGCTRRPQAGFADAVLGAGARRARQPCRHPRRRLQRRHRFGRRHRRRAQLEPPGQEAVIHRLDGGRQAADDAVRDDGQEGVARAGRQRAVHRVRRCRPRRRGRGCDGLEVPQQRPDLRLRQPRTTCRTAFTTRSPRRSPLPSGACSWGMDWSRRRRRDRSSTTRRSPKSRSISPTR